MEEGGDERVARRRDGQEGRPRRNSGGGRKRGEGMKGSKKGNL